MGFLNKKESQTSQNGTDWILTFCYLFFRISDKIAVKEDWAVSELRFANLRFIIKFLKSISTAFRIETCDKKFFSESQWSMMMQLSKQHMSFVTINKSKFFLLHIHLIKSNYRRLK